MSHVFKMKIMKQKIWGKRVTKTDNFRILAYLRISKLSNKELHKSKKYVDFFVKKAIICIGDIESILK